MELVTFITLLILCFSSINMQSAYASPRLLFKLSASEQGAEHDLQLKLPAAAIPTKLRLMQLEENDLQESSGNKNYVSQEKHEEESAGELHQRETDARKVTHQEWDQQTDASQFFNMDYWHVRKRQPIHNKFVPVAP